MTTRLLIVASDLWAAKTWAERNARFTIGFDEVIKATAAEVEENALTGAAPYDGVVLVRQPLDGPSSSQVPLLRVLRHTAARSSIVVASAPRPEDEIVRCRVCGCTDLDACVDEDTGPCHWVERDLCSSCVGNPEDGS